jgi:hypothetical protein
MRRVESMLRRRLASAGWAVLIGFAGSVVGLVYGWSSIFDKGWFILCLTAALWLIATEIRAWYRRYADALPHHPEIRQGQSQNPKNQNQVQD